MSIVLWCLNSPHFRSGRWSVCTLANISLRGLHPVYVQHDYWVSGQGHFSNYVTWELSGSRKGPLKPSGQYLPVFFLRSLGSAGPAHCSATTIKGKMSPRPIWICLLSSSKSREGIRSNGGTLLTWDGPHPPDSQWGMVRKMPSGNLRPLTWMETHSSRNG